MRDGWYGSNRFVCTTLKSIFVKPVILPPGRAKLATKPCTTGFIHHDKHSGILGALEGLKIGARV
jgi:hypothetical protein